MKITCGHCGEELENWDDHDCEPECHHCGATFEDLENPEYESAKVAVSLHQRGCEERPESWDEPIHDPEAEFRAERRRKKRIREMERRRRKKKYVW
jgi:hypothetical protein